LLGFGLSQNLLPTKVTSPTTTGDFAAAVLGPWVLDRLQEVGGSSSGSYLPVLHFGAGSDSVPSPPLLLGIGAPARLCRVYAGFGPSNLG